MAFPNDRDRQLQRDTRETLAFADELMEWMGTFNPQRKAARVGLIPVDEEFQLLSLRRKASSLYRSSRVPAAAAVYGPSQVGKSLFVGRVLQPQDPHASPLGRDENAGPPAYYPRLSFEHDLNPRCGSQEATAIVSRFTTKDRFDEEARQVQEYPVLVRGLSRSEWLRVLSRGFRSECSMPGKEWMFDESSLEELFSKTAVKYPACETDRQWRMDLLDVYTYLQRREPLRYQVEEAYVNGLLSRYPLAHPGYVDIAAKLCWADWPDLTALFLRIEGFLERIRQHGRDGILLHWAAVRFLLDSQQKSWHESPASFHFPRVDWCDIVDQFVDGWYVLDYQPGQGPPREPLTTIQAAMLEMVIPILPDRLNPEWRSVLAEIDFLDIPGMRASGSGETTAVVDDASAPEAQQNIVKRGKVFYLFERYIEELQAQTLLMLIRGGKLEVSGYLKEYLDKWGLMRYGKDRWPHGVQDRPPAFFLGLTGIDEEFEKDHPTSSLYDARLKDLVHRTFTEVMLNFGGPGQPFTNVYPIRYPGTWDNDEPRRRQFGRDKWDKAREAFLASPYVQRHVEDAARKWDIAMQDGDGGASLLAAAFRHVTSSHRKQDELQAWQRETRQQLENLARSWLVDPNANADRERRIRLAQDVLDWFLREPRLINRRVLAMKETLSFRRGDVLAIADIADVQQEYLNPLPLESRLPDVLRTMLRTWATTWAPDRWQDYTARHREAGQWLDGEAFAALARYLADYLTSETVFAGLCDRIGRVAGLKVANLADRRVARRKLVRMILNDYVICPGDPAETIEPLAENGNRTPVAVAAVNGDSRSTPLLTAFVERWQVRLPAVVAAGAGNKVNIPAGNSELFEILQNFGAS
jgi:hypothetical protein